MSELAIPAAEPEWAAFAAIDWADQKNFWRMVPADSKRQEAGELNNTPEAVEVWAASLEQRFGGRPIAVCLEQSRGPLVYMLAKYPHLVLYPVHPTTAALYRKTFCTSGASDDPSDTASLLDLLLRHREELRPRQPDTVETRLLQFLVEARRRAVDEKTRGSNRLTDCLKQYFPQILQWFDDVTSPLVGAVLERWGSLEQLQRAHPGTQRKFLHQHNCRGKEHVEGLIRSMAQAMPATRDQAVLEAGVMIARGLAAQLAALRSSIAVFDKRIEELVQEHPDSRLFGSLPGSGPVMTPRLMVALGTNRDRYQSASELQSYSGIAPVKEASGKKEWIHCRFICPKFLRQTFHEFAGHSITKSEWAKAYYQHLRRDQKKDHHAAVRALAFKWIRIIYRCWKDSTCYDEQVYLQSLRRRGSLLGASMAAATTVGWQPVAGFQKLSEKTA
jgi:transposase